jgi:Cu+-exporting ATPase
MGNSADVSLVSDIVIKFKIKIIKRCFYNLKKTYKFIKQNLAYRLIYNTITIPIAAMAGFVIPFLLHYL